MREFSFALHLYLPYDLCGSRHWVHHMQSVSEWFVLRSSRGLAFKIILFFLDKVSSTTTEANVTALRFRSVIDGPAPPVVVNARCPSGFLKIPVALMPLVHGLSTTVRCVRLLSFLFSLLHFSFTGAQGIVEYKIGFCADACVHVVNGTLGKGE